MERVIRIKELERITHGMTDEERLKLLGQIIEALGENIKENGK